MGLFEASIGGAEVTSRYEKQLKLCGVSVETVRSVGKYDRYEEVALVCDDGKAGRVVIIRNGKGEVTRTFVELTTLSFVGDHLARSLFPVVDHA